MVLLTTFRDINLGECGKHLPKNDTPLTYSILNQRVEEFLRSHSYFRFMCFLPNYYKISTNSSEQYRNFPPLIEELNYSNWIEE